MAYELLGTCHFASVRAARRYYLPYGDDAASVAAKIAEGAIFIGPPAFDPAPGRRLRLIDDNTRWAIETETDTAGSARPHCADPFAPEEDG